MAVKKYAGPALGADLTKVPGKAPLAALPKLAVCNGPDPVCPGGDAADWPQLWELLPMEAVEEVEGEVDMRDVSGVV